MSGVKCIDNRDKRKNARKRRNGWIVFLSVVLAVLCIAAGGIYYFKEIDIVPEHLVADYISSSYRNSWYRDILYTENLCVASDNVSLENAPDMTGVSAAALFNLDDSQVDFAYNIHQRVYPASTTKILTALLALKHGNLEDVVTVSYNADADRFAKDESTCGIKTGDRLTLKDLLCGLLMQSGNDTAVAIAEYIGGSNEAFVQMMNEQAAELKASQSHFVNSNGLHNDNHYTTAYDLYLIFNECVKYPDFVSIIETKEYTAHVTGADGAIRDMKFEPTNFYALGEVSPPDNVTIIGGKTGTTKSAGNCLILLEKTLDGKPYISIIMGAESKKLLYQDMNAVIQAIPAG